MSALLKVMGKDFYYWDYYKVGYFLGFKRFEDIYMRE